LKQELYYLETALFKEHYPKQKADVDGWSDEVDIRDR